LRSRPTGLNAIDLLAMRALAEGHFRESLRTTKTGCALTWSDSAVGLPIWPPARQYWANSTAPRPTQEAKHERSRFPTPLRQADRLRSCLAGDARVRRRAGRRDRE
jgi:hypothetical protein